MTAVAFGNLFLVAVVATAVPFALGLVPRLRIPAVVVELLAGIALGPTFLGLVAPDAALAVVATIGLAFLLFLGGLEIEVDRLRGPMLRGAVAGFGMSIVLAIGVAGALGAIRLIGSPLIVAVILLATSLGVVVPILRDAGRSSTTFGQAVIAAGSVADFGAIIVLSILFSREATSVGAQLLLLVGLAVTAAVLVVAAVRAERIRRVSAVLLRLQDTTAQIRIRAAFLLLVALVALAEALGLELILGAFLAGVVVAVVDRDERMTHPLFREKLAAIGFGVFIPVFFVWSGLTLDVRALVDDPSRLALVPLFLAALGIVRGLPAIALRGVIERREIPAAGWLQATSLPFIVSGTRIAVEIGALDPATAAALVVAGVLSVLLFPALALRSLAGRPVDAARSTSEPARTSEAM
jgi:Kef-type K+ transport system membrane component KefB